MTALVIGATGLVGSSLLQQLLADNRFTSVRIFVRRSTGIIHQKLEEYLIDFDEPANWQPLVKGDVLYSALGTTISKAGSKEAQYRIDYTYQYEFAAAAASQGVPVYVLVSSAMADPDSRIFYTRMKGELERDVSKLPFQSIQILQPSFLDGERKENRTGEKIGLVLIKLLNKAGLFKKQKPIAASTVAKAMINLTFRGGGIQRYSYLEVFTAAGEK